MGKDAAITPLRTAAAIHTLKRDLDDLISRRERSQETIKEHQDKIDFLRGRIAELNIFISEIQNGLARLSEGT